LLDSAGQFLFSGGQLPGGASQALLCRSKIGGIHPRFIQFGLHLVDAASGCLDAGLGGGHLPVQLVQLLLQTFGGRSKAVAQRGPCSVCLGCECVVILLQRLDGAGQLVHAGLGGWGYGDGVQPGCGYLHTLTGSAGLLGQVSEVFGGLAHLVAGHHTAAECLLFALGTCQGGLGLINCLTIARQPALGCCQLAGLGSGHFTVFALGLGKLLNPPGLLCVFLGGGLHPRVCLGYRAVDALAFGGDQGLQGGALFFVGRCQLCLIGNGLFKVSPIASQGFVTGSCLHLFQLLRRVLDGLAGFDGGSGEGLKILGNGRVALLAAGLVNGLRHFLDFLRQGNGSIFQRLQAGGFFDQAFEGSGDLVNALVGLAYIIESIAGALGALRSAAKGFVQVFIGTGAFFKHLFKLLVGGRKFIPRLEYHFRCNGFVRHINTSLN